MRTFLLLVVLDMIFMHGFACAETSFSWDKTHFSCGYEGKIFTENIRGVEIVDADAYGPDVFLLLAKPGASQGERLRRYTVSGQKMNVRWERNVRRYKPWKLRVGDVDGDGTPELILGARGKARFHPVEAKRLFVFNIEEEGITAKWLGSRLARPLVDFEFLGDELLAVESNPDGGQRLAAYRWNGFGFTMDREIVGRFELKSFTVRNGKAFLNSAPMEIYGRQP